MGWSSGGYIFEVVADSVLPLLDQNKITEDGAMKIFVRLIQHLQREDWDTENESLGRYAHPVITEAFAECEIFRFDDPRNPDFGL